MVVVHASDPPDLKDADPVSGTKCTEGGDQVCMCASACVFVWAAGRPRFGNMLRKFGTPEIVVEAAVNTPNQSPRRLSEDELQAMQPFTYVPDDDRD